MCVVDGCASRDETLHLLKGLVAVLDLMNLEAGLLEASLCSSNAFGTGSFGIRMISKGSQLGVRFHESGEGVVDVGVLGAGNSRHGVYCSWVGWLVEDASGREMIVL